MLLCALPKSAGASDFLQAAVMATAARTLDDENTCKAHCLLYVYAGNSWLLAYILIFKLTSIDHEQLQAAKDRLHPHPSACGYKVLVLSKVDQACSLASSTDLKVSNSKVSRNRWNAMSVMTTFWLLAESQQKRDRNRQDQTSNEDIDIPASPIVRLPLTSAYIEVPLAIAQYTPVQKDWSADADVDGEESEVFSWKEVGSVFTLKEGLHVWLICVPLFLSGATRGAMAVGASLLAAVGYVIFLVTEVPHNRLYQPRVLIRFGCILKKMLVERLEKVGDAHGGESGWDSRRDRRRVILFVMKCYLRTKRITRGGFEGICFRTCVTAKSLPCWDARFSLCMLPTSVPVSYHSTIGGGLLEFDPGWDNLATGVVEIQLPV
ncbi:hypothetical protein BDY19DRAFT_1015609 [Irpex rosettiformis]|uniref:Uncharacterized protein n=1 Tax=Irpex rosettiformis TaxID=378272 RepID=A0ACB8TXL1_9APHY|nr:hypothetical protein BDY19DRAFT_1015609 [Irpex rosettiformis]